MCLSIIPQNLMVDREITASYISKIIDRKYLYIMKQFTQQPSNKKEKNILPNTDQPITI